MHCKKFSFFFIDITQIIHNAFERIYWKKDRDYSWLLMIKSNVNNFNLIFIELWQRYPHYRQVRLINVNT